MRMCVPCVYIYIQYDSIYLQNVACQLKAVVSSEDSSSNVQFSLSDRQEDGYYCNRSTMFKDRVKLS